MNEYIVAYMLKPLDEGQQFEKWPLHMTILPWFSSPDASQTEKIVADMAASHAPLTLKADGTAQFGHDRTVRLIVSTDRLSQLYDDLSQQLKDAGSEFTVKLYEAYQPHVTVKDTEDVQSDSEVIVDTMYLIQAPRNGMGHGTKKVVAKFGLTGKSDDAPAEQTAA